MTGLTLTGEYNVNRKILIIILFFSLAAFPAYGDIIKLKNGRIYEGEVEKKENGILELKIRGGKVSIPVDLIVEHTKSEVDLETKRYAVKYSDIQFADEKDLAARISKRIS